ncbi:MAG TPA: methyl-accepting chemotaxis protein [Caulobacteraceae bacterium]|nr:methyl-accepting chemotaxis protein [Caulobacteraceae bacterium]
MDFHKWRDMRKPMALVVAAAGSAPMLLISLAYLVVLQPLLHAGAPRMEALCTWGLVAALGLTVLAGALFGWCLGSCIQTPLRLWRDRSKMTFEKVFRNEPILEPTPYLDYQGALGDLTRLADGASQWLNRQIEDIGKASKQAEEIEAAKRAQDQAIAAQAAEQSAVIEILAGALAKLAGGDLTGRLGGEFPVSYRQVQDDFNAAMEQLQSALKALALSALGIRIGTDEISQSAGDLSRRTENQAASLEETAAALNQITSTVRKTADSATEASEVVLTAKTDAERSGQVVRDAVSAMSEIERSAEQISKIIGVIDEIAFQTNLLALNAGVEAARAGDAGKGFSVVASEVRALAQRSAAAAKEIKALISTSSGQVGRGVQLVGETGQALDRILSRVAEINSLMSGIAASAKEQAVGLHEINGSINQMDHVTQQNAAMVQESTAASFALVTEAQQLSELIKRFDIGEVIAPAMEQRPTRPAPSPRRQRALRVAGGASLDLDVDADQDGWEEF